MNSTIIRKIALPVVSAGVLGGAALGLAGMASASPAYHPEPRPGIVAVPEIKAPPAPEVRPGGHWHHGMYQVQALQPSR